MNFSGQTEITILGGGPAGSAAALAALAAGAPVRVAERSRLPRHKVCGEFLSPEIAPVLDQLGVWEDFVGCQPASIRRMSVHLGTQRMTGTLPQPAYGLSRYTFDALLQGATLRAGATIERELQASPTVVATGRCPGRQSKGERLFGFKAHFEGPADDAVELFFFGRCYVGLNAVEGGATNVCGLGPESVIRRFGFDIDALLATSEPLRERIAPLRRTINWLHCGPLEFRQNWRRRDVYVAGDALSFVDPFTGSGLLSALVSGSLAGSHAAAAIPVEKHVLACRARLHRPFAFARALRSLAASRWAELLSPMVPARLLYHITRPVLR